MVPKEEKGCFAFGVYPVDRDHLDLETGEVFRNPQRAGEEYILGEQYISGSLTVRRALAEDSYHHNAMFYLEGVSSSDGFGDSPSSIHFSVCLPSDDFQELVVNTRSGLLPSTVSVELEHSIWDKSASVAMAESQMEAE
jgi:hypothetical protein